MNTYDFIIVGGGIAGASAAYALAADARVLMIERESQFGYHSTGRSAALFLQSHGPAVVRGLACGSKTFFLNPPAGFTDYELLRARGMLFIGAHGQELELDHIAEECRRFVNAIKRLDARTTREMVPVLKETAVAGAVFDPEAMDMDVHAIHYGFIRGARTRGGVTLEDAEMLDAAYADGRWKLHTTAGLFVAPVVINAAGAWCDKVGEIFGAQPLGLVPKRRTAFIFDPPNGVDCGQWPVVHDVGETFYFKPEAGKILASPADETPMEPCDVHPDDLDIATAVARIQRTADLPITHINRKWAGLRSFVADGCPVAGYDPAVEGFFWLAGQGGYGIETSPAMGRLCASLAMKKGVPDDLAALGVRERDLSPARFKQ
ncbi:MAG: NAD(P)/FAD-dependent oxidoreductase [Candidatus Binataceae bacterium]